MLACASSVLADSLTIEGELNVQALSLDNGAADGANLRLLSALGQPQWNLDNSTEGLRFFTETAPDTDTSVKAILTPAGNFGLGTSLPSERLDVVGNARITGTLTVSGSFIVPNSGGVFSGGLIVTSDNSSTGGLTLGSGTVVDGANLRLLSNTGKPQWNIDNNAGNMRFFTESAPNTGLSVKAVISAAGNLGLGTAAPTERLDVVGNAKINGSLTVTGNSNLDGEVTVKAKLRVPPNGNISMGEFTGGTNPGL
jgi:hypothetical protein